MLTTDQINQISLDMALGRKPTVIGPDADKMRADIQAEMDQKHYTWADFEIPFEIPDIGAPIENKPENQFTKSLKNALKKRGRNL